MVSLIALLFVGDGFAAPRIPDGMPGTTTSFQHMAADGFQCELTAKSRRRCSGKLVKGVVAVQTDVTYEVVGDDLDALFVVGAWMTFPTEWAVSDEGRKSREMKQRAADAYVASGYSIIGIGASDNALRLRGSDGGIIEISTSMSGHVFAQRYLTLKIVKSE